MYRWNISDLHVFFVGSCSVDQECIPIQECPFTKKLKKIIKSSSDKDEKRILKQVINARRCGGSCEETVCCDIVEGNSFLYYLGAVQKFQSTV